MSVVSEQDVHGNAVLHYLATNNVVNYKLIEWLRLQHEGHHAWNTLPNRCGFAAQDVLVSNVAAVKKPRDNLFGIHRHCETRQIGSRNSNYERKLKIGATPFS